MIERLRLGTIIPDSSANREEYMLTHLKINIGDEHERTYDLTRYRTLFAEKMKQDDFYLGYYLNLIQDILYRHFIYEKYCWNFNTKEHIERLYDDYRQINAYLINKYKMQNDIHIPDDFGAEQINNIAHFEPIQFMEEFKKDFEPIEYKERFFLTDSMVDEYIQFAVEYCQRELNAFRAGSYYFDEYEWSWGK